jgi:ABC-type bacteriocin/lantibiotic exporter with double-glycine peptidase domain
MARQISGLVLELVNGAPKFRVSGVEDRAFARWAAAFSTQKRTAADARRVSNILSVFHASFPVIATALLFYGMAVLSQRQADSMTTGQFLAFYAAFGQFLGAVLGISAAALTVLQAVPLYESAQPILTALPEAAGGRGDPGDLRGGIELAHVAFRYSSETPLVLRDVSVSIRPGEFVAIVGPSGSGKSTLLRLLLGFETPESGSVYFDGKDLAGLDLEAVRRQMGVVLQHGKLMIGDIFTNIIGSAPLTLDDAWRAAEMAGLDRDIKAMPMGMHTMIAEGGGGLSGGQRQRLMIARAIVGSPRILLFDEATSALDNRTQAIVSRALESLKATRIVIAHRLSTVMHADRILVVEKGVLVQSGTYDELIRQEGPFAELARRQLV